ncbi:MAG TPA: hypothetical protein DCQ98_05120 [Planctomycetaceae bacterium]|nr:hypothetical protein [Planctomycetaceae bacterium]
MIAAGDRTGLDFVASVFSSTGIPRRSPLRPFESAYRDAMPMNDESNRANAWSRHPDEPHEGTLRRQRAFDPFDDERRLEADRVWEIETRQSLRQLAPTLDIGSLVPNADSPSDGSARTERSEFGRVGERPSVEASRQTSDAARPRWPTLPFEFGPLVLRQSLGATVDAANYRGHDRQRGDSLVVRLTCNADAELFVRRRLSTSRVPPIVQGHLDPQGRRIALVMRTAGTTLLERYRLAWRHHRRPRGRSEFGRLGPIESPCGKGLLPETWFEVVLGLAIGMARTLRDLHRDGLVLGSPTPERFLLDGTGEVRLIDLAGAVFDGDPIGRIDRSPPFVPPEHLESLTLSNSPERDTRDDSVEGAQPLPVAHRSIDIFAFGVTLYLLCAGRYPFGRSDRRLDRVDDARRLLAMQRRGAERLDRLDRSLPRPFVELVDRCLAFSPCDRPIDAERIIERLESLRRPVARRLARWRSLLPERVRLGSATEEPRDRMR